MLLTGLKKILVMLPLRAFTGNRGKSYLKSHITSSGLNLNMIHEETNQIKCESARLERLDIVV